MAFVLGIGAGPLGIALGTLLAATVNHYYPTAPHVDVILILIGLALPPVLATAAGVAAICLGANGGRRRLVEWAFAGVVIWLLAFVAIGFWPFPI